MITAKEALKASIENKSIYEKESEERAFEYISNLIIEAVKKGLTEISDNGWVWYNNGFNDKVAERLKELGYYVQNTFTGKAMLSFIGWADHSKYIISEEEKKKTEEEFKSIKRNICREWAKAISNKL